MAAELAPLAESPHRLRLPQHPAPRELLRELLEDEVEQHRSLWCAHYDDCVDRAVRSDWTSFSCSACPVWRGDAVDVLPAARTIDSRAERLEAILEILASGGTWTAPRIAKALGVESLAVQQDLSRLNCAGRVRRLERGLYEARA